MPQVYNMHITSYLFMQGSGSVFQHFDFLAPCPAELIKTAPTICTDRSGFDRAAFHREFNAEVLAFFRKHLADAQ